MTSKAAANMAYAATNVRKASATNMTNAAASTTTKT
jgi:hypothetical protein